MAAVSGVVIGAFLLSTPVAWGQAIPSGLPGGWRGGGLPGGRRGVGLPPSPSGVLPRAEEPRYEPLPDEPELSVSQDDSRKVLEVTNLTEEEVKLENGLTLGPRASLDLRGTERIISGYVIRNGVKYTAEGTVENLTEKVVLLDGGSEEPVILGPKAVLDSEGKPLAGYMIFAGRKYRAGRSLEPMAK